MGSHRRRDLAFAVGIGVLVLAWTGAVGRVVPADRPLDAGGYLLGTACAVALVWRRDAPLPVLAATTVCTTGYLSVGYPYGPMPRPARRAAARPGRTGPRRCVFS